ncbi:MAG TPA: GH116 family glycosyl-hydrolase, partial [Hanamia sp.]|nr:GH116 family glycosyl-hydrolase [Hanamia sp.]
MKHKASRRKFIKGVGLGTIASSFFPAALLTNSEKNQDKYFEDKENSQSPVVSKNYSGEYLNRVAFPVGGMGAGMFCVEGTGAISHMSVRNKPDVFNEPAMFAALAIKGITNGAKVIEGPVPDWKKFGQLGSGNGSGSATTGLPRFHKAVFNSKFPFATIQLSDSELPVKVELTAWSPFIPTDENNSSLPVGALAYRITNTGSKTIDAVFSYNSVNFLKVDTGKNSIRPFHNGFILSENGTKEKPFLKSDFAIFSDDENTIVDHSWFRGGWFDPLTIAWESIKNAEVKSVPPVAEGAPGASLYIPFTLAPGKVKSLHIYLCWYVPDSNLTYGTQSTEKEDCDPKSGCCTSPSQLDLDPYDKDFDGPFYKPWYSSQFKNAEEVCEHWKTEYSNLLHNTKLFSDAFYASTLPGEVIEAIACNLSILKSPTVLRQYDGRLWSFEGCADDEGCCHGSCTHVWNYAQAIPHLFPKLERSLRHTEFCEDQNAKGHQNFRTLLPIKPADHSFYAAADGQLGGIMKVYREWRIGSDVSWIKKMFPMVKKSLNFCISTWDPKDKGVIEEPHHNTYDIEFWGPEGLCTSFYLGALTAFIAMGKFLGEDVNRYEQLFSKGKDYLENKLFNGEYFFQEIKYSGLKA